MLIKIIIDLTCNGINGVEGAKDGGAGGAVDEEGKAALRLVLQHPLLKFLGDHPAPEKCVLYLGWDGFVYTKRVLAEIGF